MNFSGEFGGSVGGPPGGQPTLLGRGYDAGGADVLAAITPPPPGQLYVLTGLDFFGSSTGAATVTGGLSEAAEGFWALEVLLTTPSFVGGGSWRGYIPVHSTDSYAASCSVRGVGAGELGLIAWGIVLEYPAG